jgi:hypothetical protein
LLTFLKKRLVVFIPCLFLNVNFNFGYEYGKRHSGALSIRQNVALDIIDPFSKIISADDDYSLLQSHLTIKLCWNLEQFLRFFASHLHAMGSQEFSSKLR